MSDFIIRKYDAADQADVIDLWIQCGLVVPQNDPGRDIDRKLKVHPGWFLVGQLKGKVIATCMAGYEGHRGWINYLGVDPKCRNLGIGTRLVRHAVAELEKIGCQKVILQVRTSNTGVIAFYKTLGFIEDETVSLGYRIKKTQ